MTPMQAIRAKCLDCCCDSVNEVRQCPVASCSLYPFRLGHNPNIRREMTEEELEAKRQLMAKVNEARRRERQP